MKIVPVKDEPQLVRDMENQAILNTDSAALHAYKKRRDKIRSMETDINSMKEDLSEIKQLLTRLLNDTTNS